MKKILSYLAAVAAILAVASCNKEPVQPEIETPVEPEYQTVSFDVAVPSAPQTRTSYGETVTFETKLKVAVYVGNTGDVKQDDLNIFGVPGTYLPDVATDIVEKEPNKWNVTLTLVKNYHYDIVFWAQAESGAPYSIDWNNATITADYKVAANNVKRDAFYHLCEDYCYLDAVENGSTKIELKRPFAQVNIGSADYKELDALYKKAGKKSDLQTTITTQTTATAKVPSVFHLLTGRADTETDMAFALAPTTPEDRSYNLVDPANDIKIVTGTGADGKDITKSYTLVGMNYIFANPITENPTTDLTLTFAYNGRSFTVDVPNAPYARNYQTNILGNFFTSSNEFEVIIKPEFEGKDHIYDTDLALADAFEEDRDVNYTLTADQTITEPLVLDNGHTFVLNLEDHEISNTSALYDENNGKWSLISVRNGSTLVINADEGSMIALKDDCFAVDVQEGGELIINGGKYVGNISAVYVHKGTAVINGGEFSIQQKSSFNDERYTLNCFDANYDSGDASIIVNGGSFINFNPADNAAEGPQTSFVDESHKSVESENADGSKTYTVVPLNAIELALSDVNATSVALTEDIDLTETIEIPAGRNLVIDMGEFRLRSPEENQTALLINGNATIKGGRVAVKKEFIRMGAGASVVLQDVTVSSSSDNCVFIPKDAAGASVNVGAGTSLTSYNAAVIQSNGNTTGLNVKINGRVTSDGDVAVYLPQVAECTIGDGAEIKGTTAVEIRAGKLVVEDGAKLTADAATFNAQWNGNGSTIEGAAVAVSPHSTNLPISVTIDGGEFTGVYAFYEEDLSSDRSETTILSIKGGIFNGKVFSESCTGFITGGTFSVTPASEYYAPVNNE